jgi:hypothetical protein
MHHFQNIQNLSNMPNMPNMPNIQNMPNMQNIPNMQNMPLESNNQLLQLFRRQQMSQAARVQQAQQMNATNTPNAVSMFSANQQLPGLLGEGHGHGVQLGVVPPHPMGGGGFVQSSGMDTANVGYDLIHSYMQRNGADASGSGSN